MGALFAQVDGRFAQIDNRFAQVDDRFAQVDARFALLEARIIEEGQKTRRHFDVVLEDIRTELREVAASASAAHARLEANRSEHETFTGVLDDHELRLKSLEHYRRR